MAAQIKTVALLSATGNLGGILLEVLERQGFAMTIIQRQSSKATFPNSNAAIRIVSDAYTEEELTTAFSGLDAVVLSLPYELTESSRKFATASIKAGNKWFIASTYGPDLDDPEYCLFPGNIIARQAVDDLEVLQKGPENWKWTALSTGQWTDLLVAVNAWGVNPVTKTASFFDDGTHVFTSTTRSKVGLTIAGIFRKQPDSAVNQIVYTASFEVSMLTLLDVYKQIVGSDGWTISFVDSKEKFAASEKLYNQEGRMMEGVVGMAVVMCTAAGFQNQFSKHHALITDELDLPKEDLVEVVKYGISLQGSK